MISSSLLAPEHIQTGPQMSYRISTDDPLARRNCGTYEILSGTFALGYTLSAIIAQAGWLN